MPWPSSSRRVFAAVMIGLGVIGLVHGNSAMIWEGIPKGLPGRPSMIYLCSVVEIATGVGLLLPRTIALASRVLLAFLLLWLVLLKLPALLRTPQVMVSWESFAEVATTAAGAWCIFAVHAGAWERRHLAFAGGDRGIRAARLLFIAALP
ncbi:MAG TPA: hypothetical protein VMK12_08540, partial [Anaeromyxobacteraceae bacterium]|nr:hypothetical protein [Anaeromyxobacteraceae bacterium]